MKRCPTCDQPLAADVGCLNIDCPSFRSTQPSPNGDGVGILTVDATKIDKNDFICVFCGTKFAPDANFCGSCGKSRAACKTASAPYLQVVQKTLSSPLIPTFSRRENDEALARPKADTRYSYIRPPHNDKATTMPPPRRPRPRRRPQS